MSVKWKICKRCGRKVNEVAVICPYCSCDEFHTTDITIKSNFPEKLKRGLFYTNYNNGNYVFSGIKFSSIAAIIVLALCFFPNSLSSFVIWIIAVIALIFILSRLMRNDNIGENALKAKMKTSTGNLSVDIRNFMFCCYEEKGFRYSKTKIISLSIYIVSVIVIFSATSNPLLALILGLILFIPTYLVGSAIHRKSIANKEVTENEIKETPKHKIEKKVSKNNPFIQYLTQVYDLADEFEIKQNRARSAVEKRFEPPQITYDKFIAVIDSSCNLFESEVKSIESIAISSDEPSEKLVGEINSKISILKLIIEKIDSLTDELILSMSKSDDGKTANILEDLENLKDSIKDY